jgi:hypothetical protein
MNLFLRWKKRQTGGNARVEVLQSTNHDSVIVTLPRGEGFFSYLSLQKPTAKRGAAGKKFDTDAKSTIYLREVLKLAPKCSICEGYIHRNLISIHCCLTDFSTIKSAEKQYFEQQLA